jgi:hypothetical protein
MRRRLPESYDTLARAALWPLLNMLGLAQMTPRLLLYTGVRATSAIISCRQACTDNVPESYYTLARAVLWPLLNMFGLAQMTPRLLLYTGVRATSAIISCRRACTDNLPESYYTLARAVLWPLLNMFGLAQMTPDCYYTQARAPLRPLSAVATLAPTTSQRVIIRWRARYFGHF